MATKKNDPVKPKKDKWGRTEGSKYYSFNPETKKYEDSAKAKDYYGRKQDSFRYAVDKALTGEYQGKRADPVEDFSNMLQGKKTKKPNYLELQKKGGTVKMKTKKKYQDGGSYRDQKKAAKQDQKLAAINAKTERIKAGTEPSTYEKVSNITGNVAKAAGSAAEVANAVRDTRTGSSGPGGMKKGGTVKKYQDGGMTGFEKRQAKKLGRAQTRAAVASIEGEGTVAQKRDNRATRVATMAGTGRAKTPKSVSTSTSNSTSTVNNSQAPRMTKPTQEPKTTGKTVTKPGVSPSKPTPEYKKTSVKTVSRDSVKSPVRYKTGGMVNSNAKVSALKSAGSHGVKSGVNPKAAASKIARGRVGGTSSAPKTAVPKAKYGMVMRKK